MTEFVLQREDKRILLLDAFESICAEIESRSPHFQRPTEVLKTPCGAFVTLHKHGTLRGCIGNITGSDPLLETIRKMAVSSAFHDPRFPSLKADELPDIEIEISVLSPLRKIKSVKEIEIGKHGLYIKKGHSSGLLLPQVAIEQNWELDAFLTNTCYKAGLPGTCWKDSHAEIFIFTADIFDHTLLND
jgi:uncharacterized protein